MPRKSKPSIRIRRSGLFTCHGLVSADQCGSVGMQGFSYKVEVYVDRLDGRGFVCDNIDIHKVMQSWNDGRSYRASCEMFAGGAVRKLHELCPKALRIWVEVSPIPDAGVSVDWRRGMSLPDFHPVRVT